MSKDKEKGSTAKLTDCLCTWIISPISVEYPEEELEEFYTEAERTRRLSLPSRHRTHYIREIKHDIHPECKVHKGLLEMSALPDQAHEVSAMRLLDERDMITKEDAEEMVRAFTNRYPELIQVVQHLWDRNRTAVITARKVGKSQVTRLGDRYRDRLAEGAEMGVEMLVDQGPGIGVQRVEVPPVLNIREVVDEANRRTYEDRKAGNFFTPVDDPEGEGHCRECHHECRFEHGGMLERASCMSPTCGHTAGCPSC